MSIRRRFAIVFIGVNGVAVVLVLIFLLFQHDEVKDRLDEQRVEIQSRRARLLAWKMIAGRLESEAREAMKRDDFHSLVIDLSELAFWDEDPEVREYLDRAVLVRYSSDEGTMVFPPRPGLRFREDGRDGFSEADIRDIVANTEDVKVRRDAQGRFLVSGVIDLDVDEDKSWGVLFRLRNPEGVDFDPQFNLKVVAAILLGATLILFGSSFILFRRKMLDPLSELERAAVRASEGDYDQRIALADHGDELGKVAAEMNAMMGELARYRDRMEGLVGDATDRFKKAERQLVLAQRLAAMGQLAAGVAHEINNPLGGVLNAVRGLAKPDLAEDRRVKYRAIAIDGLERIEVIVRRLLDTAPKTPQVEVRRFEEIAAKTRDLVHNRLEAKSINFSMTIEPGLKVLGDHNELVQVLMNLVINAADAVDEGGHVTVGGIKDGPMAVITVKDDGHGMSAHEASLIFDLFYTTKPGTEGTGLGLSIVHNIVSGHGGEITVESQPEEGTIFRFTLPAAEAGEENQE